MFASWERAPQDWSWKPYPRLLVWVATLIILVGDCPETIFSSIEFLMFPMGFLREHMLKSFIGLQHAALASKDWKCPMLEALNLR